MSGVHFSAFDASAYMPPGFIGSLVDADHLNQIDTVINADPQATKTYTVVVTADANSQVHTYTVDNVAVSYTSDASGTKAEIIAGLLAAHNAKGYARGRFTIASDGVDTLTLTGISPAVDSVVADSDSNLVTTLTRAAAAASTVAFGVACIRNGSSNDHYGDTGSVAYAAKFTAMVQTLTIAYTSGAVYRVDIEWRGRTYSASTIGATDLAATNAALFGQGNMVPGLHRATDVGIGAVDRVYAGFFRVRSDVPDGKLFCFSAFYRINGSVVFHLDQPIYIFAIEGHRGQDDALPIPTNDLRVQ